MSSIHSSFRKMFLSSARKSVPITDAKDGVSWEEYNGLESFTPQRPTKKTMSCLIFVLHTVHLSGLSCMSRARTFWLRIIKLTQDSLCRKQHSWVEWISTISIYILTPQVTYNLRGHLMCFILKEVYRDFTRLRLLKEQLGHILLHQVPYLTYIVRVHCL